MGKLLKAKFVAAHQQAGDFDAVVQDGKVVQKNGGNVASYFCTPDGRVVNAVIGPVGADALLREAQWAVNVYESIESLSPNDRDARLASAHVAAAGQPGDAQARQIHRFLAQRPLAGLDEIYRSVFDLLGEGERASRLESSEVVALEEDNQRLVAEAQRLAERLPDGRGSLKLRRERAENERLKDEVGQLRQRGRKLAKYEADAFNWLRTAISYLGEDEEAGKARLRIVIKRYPNAKAAKKAAQLLARTAND